MTAPTPPQPQPQPQKAYRTRPPMANANAGRPTGAGAVPPEDRVTAEVRAAVLAEHSGAEAGGAIPMIVLYVVGGLLALIGFLIMFSATSIFVAILGGSVFAAGSAFLAGGIVVTALRH